MTLLLTLATTIGEEFAGLWWEANQNGNLNWICFPESADRFRAVAERIQSALGDRLQPKEWGDDDDEAAWLLMQMIEDSPHDLPCSADERYQALERCLIREGLMVPAE